MDRTTALVLLLGGIGLFLFLSESGVIQLARGELPQGGLVNLRGPDFEVPPVAEAPLASISAFVGEPQGSDLAELEALGQVTDLGA